MPSRMEWQWFLVPVSVQTAFVAGLIVVKARRP
jgi:hypothetical protein